ncbi:MAG: ferredoxin [Candidatus Latescibacterota bacterium]|nr:MAG: ferredoxin [Candidatus Latescibacterota bacterium]
METVNQPEPANRDVADQTENTTTNTEAVEPSSTTEKLSMGPPSKGDLPIEPRLVWTIPTKEPKEGEPQTGYDPEKTFAELRNFHLYGNLGAEPLRHASEALPTPALLSQYQDLSRVRYDYPVCVTDGEGDLPARTLTDIVDEVIAAVADDSDDGRRLTLHIHQMESAVKTFAENNPDARLLMLWNQVGDEILEKTTLVDDEKRMLKQDVNVAQGALRVDGEVIACNATSATRLFKAAVERHWRTRCAEWRRDLDTLIHELDEILAADFARSPEARSPDHLRASVGTGKDDDLDFLAMSSILKQSDLGEPIPQSRRKRIEEILAMLRKVEPLFDDDTVIEGTDSETPLRIELVENDCSAVVHRFVDQMQTMVDFFKAVRIARLEIGNLYEEEVHDPFFAQFGVIHLTEEGFSLCPPILLTLNNEFFAEPDKGGLFDILNAGIPIKVLVQLDDLFYSADSTEGLAVALAWPARLASMAAALNHIYVMQSPLSNPMLLQRGFMEGLRYAGPALFSVYTGNRENQPGLSLYHNAAAATESRVFPAFTYAPGKGDVLAERSSILDNPQIENMWPTEPFNYLNTEFNENTIELAFTPADFLFCDVRLTGHFWRVPPSEWHQDMVPVHEFLQLDEETANSKIPYLTAVGPDGQIARVVMTRMILSLVRGCESFWGTVQEMGGVNNSFALRALAEEKERLEGDKQRDVTEIEQRYKDQLNKNIGELTREIIQRIVNQIAAGGEFRAEGEGAAAVETAPGETEVVPEVASPTAEIAPAEPAAPPEAEEEEEEISLDDPYIDTPLCTTCNECTNINNRMFAYNDNKQAFIKDPLAGSFRELVQAAEKCPVHIIHPGKPKNPSEPDLDDLTKRAAPFN